MQQEPFKSLKELIEHFIKTYNNSPNSYFRWMKNSDWDLRTTLHRFIEDNKIEVQNSVAFNSVRYKLLSNFKSNLLINGDLMKSEIEALTEDHIWEYGQHFGLPSPLLD